ncbi:hypothetical protein BGZ54_005026, partial [Gamsiella multidivaricata]
LLATIECSKIDKEVRKAAANAITILVRAGISFNGTDLKGIQIPGADLSGGQFDSAQLQGADLRKVNLRNIWLRQANLSNAQMAGVQFGEWPYLLEDSKVNSCAYSPDGKFCAVGLDDGTINVYDTSTWAKAHTLRGHTSYVTSVVYSPSGQQIASGSRDETVRLWDVNSGQYLAVVEGFHGPITSITWNATLNGTYFATGCWDKSVRMWQIVEEEDRYQVRLHWSSMHDRLTVSNTSIQDVQGLSRINMRLLEQRGAVGKLVPPLGFREASKKIISMAFVAYKLKVPSNHSMMDTGATVDSSAVQSAKSVDSANVFSLA